MLLAPLHGQLSPALLASADALTGAIFGQLRYLPARVTGAFLAAARTPAGRPLCPGALAEPSDMRLWPHFPNPLRPGARVTASAALSISGSTGRLVVLTSLCPLVPAPGDAERLAAVAAALHSERPAPAVVYLSAHAQLPSAVLRSAAETLRASALAGAPLGWLPLCALGDALSRFLPGAAGAARLAAADLWACLDRAAVLGFRGFSSAAHPVPARSWRYPRAERRYFAAAARPGPPWRYALAPYFAALPALPARRWAYAAPDKEPSHG